MDFQLTEEQAALVAAVQTILQDHMDLPQSARLNSYYFDAKLQQLLDESGFLSAGRDIGPLEAALIVEESARIPAVIEVSASALVASQLLPDEQPAGPIALVAGRSLRSAHRNLAIARTAFIDLGEDVAIVPVGVAGWWVVAAAGGCAMLREIVACSMPVATTETRITPSRFSSKVAPTMILAS